MNDVPAVTVRYEQGSYTVGEGSSVVVKVILSADPERSGDDPDQQGPTRAALADGDYSGVAANASVTFNSGEMEKSITFAATDDSVDDDGESVLLGFGTLPTRVSAGSPANLGGATTDDYSVTPTSLTFNSVETEKSITFAATNDTVDDDGESVLLSFGTLPTGVSLGINGESTVNITDNDLRSDPIADPDDPAVTVSYRQAAYSVEEGRIEIITIKLSADPERTVTIPISKANQGGGD